MKNYTSNGKKRKHVYYYQGICVIVKDSEKLKPFGLIISGFPYVMVSKSLPIKKRREFIKECSDKWFADDDEVLSAEYLR